MLFNVKYRDDQFSVKSLVLSADNVSEIESHPAFNRALVSAKAIPEWLEFVHKKRVNLDTQLLLLSQISAQVQSGGDSRAIQEILTAMPAFKNIHKDPRYRHASSVSDYLEICGVDDITKMIISAGERSGRLASAVEDATLDIEKRIDLAKAIKGDVSKGVFYVIAGAALAVIMSLMLSEIVPQLMEAKRIQVNVGTDMILFISEMFSSHIVLTIGLSIAAFTLTRYLWATSDFFRNIPLIQTYNLYRKSVRSLNFLSTWRPLYLSGEPIASALNQVRKGNKGLDREGIDDLVSRINYGHSVGDSLNAIYWSNPFIIGMKPFDKANDAAKKKLLFRIQSLLENEVQTLGRRLGKFMLTIGMVSALFGVFLMAFGFYMPMLAGMQGV